MKISKRIRTSPCEKFETFDQVMNAFKASYFAGALVINRHQVEEEIKVIFKSETWNGKIILELLKRHAVTPETFLHRLSQILPGLFKITELHYFRFEQLVGKNEIHLTKELNMPRTLVPSGVRLNEHHCQRWLPVSLLKDLKAEKGKYMSNKDKQNVISRIKAGEPDLDITELLDSLIILTITIAEEIDIESISSQGWTLKKDK